MYQMKRTVSKLQTVIAMLFVVVGTVTGHVYGQTATPSPTPSEEVQRLTEEKERAELRKAIAEARKAELEAKFPKPTTSPLAGETTINDGAVIESEMVSYLSMAYAANRIVTQLKDAKASDSETKLTITNLAIYDQADINLLLNYNVTNSQLEVIRQCYCALLAPNISPKECPAPNKTSTGVTKFALTPVSTIAGSFLGAFVDLTALLRTNVDIKGHTFDIDEAALVAEIFRAARNTGGLPSPLNLYYPAAFIPNVNVDTTSSLLGRLEVLHILRSTVDNLITQLEDDDKNIKKAESALEELKNTYDLLDEKSELASEELARLKKLKQQYGPKTPFETVRRIAELEDLIEDLKAEQGATANKIKDKQGQLDTLNHERDAHLKNLQPKLQDPSRLDGTIAQLKALNDQFDKFVDSLIKVDASSGINSLTAYVKAEKLIGVLDNDQSFWLQLDVVKAGGNNRIKTNLVTDIFRGGNRISHSGGVIVQYNLYDRTGRSVASDTFTEYTGYIKAGEIKNLGNPQNLTDFPKRSPKFP
jgi:hypothetical protein